MQDKILVTGATGFVGAQIVRQLIAKGKKVRILIRKNSNLRYLKDVEDQVELVIGDLLDVPSLEEAFQNVTQVYHAAAMISFDPKKKYTMFKINIEGTANMVNVALSSKVEKFLHVSSVSAFGRYDIRKEINEETKWVEHDDNTNYAISKNRSELEVWRAKEEGLNVVIVNPGTILGFGEWAQGSSNIFKKIYQEVNYYPTGTTGFVGVEDVAKASIQLMESDISGERFILCAKNTTYKEIFQKIAVGLNKKKPSKPVDKFLINFGWRFYWLKDRIIGQQSIISKETALYTSRNFFYQNDKIKKAIGFEFEDLDKVIERSCKKYLEAL